MLKIFGYRASINVRKVLWMCEELGLDFVQEDWAGGFRSTATPDFRKLNPAGLVPVIDDDGFVLWESNVILRYLAASRARRDLLPEEPRARATIEKWMDWQASDFNNSWRAAFQGLVRKNPQFRDADIARSVDDFCELVSRVSAEISRNGGYICYGAIGDNSYYHSAMGGRLCYAVYPGDIATALIPYDAKVKLATPFGPKELTVEQLVPGDVMVDGRLQSHVFHIHAEPDAKRFGSLSQ